MEQPPQEEPNPLMRKKKTPEELAAEAEAEDLDDFTSKLHANLFLSPTSLSLFQDFRTFFYHSFVVFLFPP